MAATVTSPRLLAMKENKEKIVAVTAYDYAFAHLADAAGIDVILVGDSLGMVVQGRSNTLPGSSLAGAQSRSGHMIATSPAASIRSASHTDQARRRRTSSRQHQAHQPKAIATRRTAGPGKWTIASKPAATSAMPV